MATQEKIHFTDTLDSRGRVLMPKGMRKALELKPGDRVEVVADTAAQTVTITKIGERKCFII